VQLPFTHDQFLDVFAAYNAAFWPVALLLWLVSLAAAVSLIVRPGRVLDSAIVGLLAVHWAWSGIAYHLVFFTAINPAAWAFGLAFGAQAVLIVWIGSLRQSLHFALERSPRHVAASVLVAYGLAYPSIVMAAGHEYPRMPAFGVPCPTTIMTIGLLLAASPPLPWPLAVIPIAWTLVGGSAAVWLDMRPDIALFVAGALLILYLLRPGTAEARHAV